MLTTTPTKKTPLRDADCPYSKKGEERRVGAPSSFLYEGKDRLTIWGKSDIGRRRKASVSSLK